MFNSLDTICTFFVDLTWHDRLIYWQLVSRAHFKKLVHRPYCNNAFDSTFVQSILGKHMSEIGHIKIISCRCFCPVSWWSKFPMHEYISTELPFSSASTVNLQVLCFRFGKSGQVVSFSLPSSTCTSERVGFERRVSC